jgi:hypothetical protein
MTNDDSGSRAKRRREEVSKEVTWPHRDMFLRGYDQGWADASEEIEFLQRLRKSQGNKIAKYRKAVKYMQQNIWKMAAPYAEETHAELTKILEGTSDGEG